MTRGFFFSAVAVAGFAIAPAPPAAAAANVKLVQSIAKEIQTVDAAGRPKIEMGPADDVLPGDKLVYSIKVTNDGAAPAEGVVVNSPIPPHTRYVARSVSGPGAKILFSADRGRKFDVPEKLRVLGKDGKPRPARADDFTHIRWTFTRAIAPREERTVQFAVVVK